MPSNLVLYNISMPEDPDELVSFVSTIKDTLEITVSSTLQNGQRLLGVEILSVGGQFVTGRILRQSIPVDYDISIEQICDTQNCSNNDVLVQSLLAQVTGTIETSVNNGNFALLLESIAQTKSVNTFVFVSVYPVASENFGSPKVIVLLPDPTESPTQKPSLAPWKSSPPSTQSPTPRLTTNPSMSQPPQQRVRRDLAARLNKVFMMEGAKDQLKDVKSLRGILEGLFAKAIPRKHHRKLYRMSNQTKREDYERNKPAFVSTNGKEDRFKCNCIECDVDKNCGGLWKASKYPGISDGKDLETKKIHIVISHCKSNLEWIDGFTQGFLISSIHIVTKCGETVKGAPEWATIEVLPNVGRCDHTYAYFITTILPQKINPAEQENSIVVFLKDDISAENFHQSGHWNDFETLVKLASSENGFACGIEPGGIQHGTHIFFLSAYHDVETLFDFSMAEYDRNVKGYNVDETEFKSQFTTLGSWYNSLNAGEVANNVTHVCYGGVFAASVDNILRRDISVWKAVETSLARGNNVLEGHYAERSWGHLLSTPLQPYQAEALISKSDGVYMNKNSMHGALIRRPKLFLHIGVKGTLSSEILAESFISDIARLKLDGYRVAVHGKYDGGLHGFPDIDRLGACLWSEVSKQRIPSYMKEAAICPEHLLSSLNDFMNHTLNDSANLILTNPWLSRPGTADPLSTFIDPSWDVNVVLYYRRYFEFITLVFDDWRRDLFNHTLTPHDIPYNSFRYIDFLREYNKRLFYGKNIEEEELPICRMNHTKSFNNKSPYMSKFDPTTEVDLVELTDLQEYSYFAAKQYYSQPRFRDVTVVNYHDQYGPDVNFYCHVLSDAHNSCEVAVQREKSSIEESERDQNFFQTDTSPPFNNIQAYEDIVIAGFHSKRLKFDGANDQFSSQVLLWAGMVHSALIQSDKYTFADLPIECLYPFEVDLLRDVSLSYEKLLMPNFFDDGADLRDDFKKWRFCSVDTDGLLSDPEWDFLFHSTIFPLRNCNRLHLDISTLTSSVFTIFFYRRRVEILPPFQTQSLCACRRT